MAQIFNQDKFTPLSVQPPIYSDLFTNFDVHPNLHDLVIRKNEDAVKGSILNIINTNKYERPFNPDFGSNIRKALFEPIMPETQDKLQTEIQSAIENYEPRARILGVVCTPYEDQNAYAVTITFYVINITNPVTLNTILYRVR
jgi:phage baseplate assembly protein W